MGKEESYMKSGQLEDRRDVCTIRIQSRTRRETNLQEKGNSTGTDRGAKVVLRLIYNGESISGIPGGYIFTRGIV